MAKPNGKKKKITNLNFNGLKQARAECREKALRRGSYWPLCWNGVTGYFCPEHSGHQDAICLVHKSGRYTCAKNKEVLKVHNLKGYVEKIYWWG